MVKKPLIEVTSFTDCEHRLPAIVGESECRYPPSLDTAAHGFSPLASLFPTCGMAPIRFEKLRLFEAESITCFVMRHAVPDAMDALEGRHDLLVMGDDNDRSKFGGHFVDDTDHGQGSYAIERRGNQLEDG